VGRVRGAGTLSEQSWAFLSRAANREPTNAPDVDAEGVVAMRRRHAFAAWRSFVRAAR
jgi:hypothetical protein